MTDTLASLCEQVTHAHHRSAPLRIVGGGTWLHAQRECSGDVLNVGAHCGVVEYTPGDLTITARAGTTLDEIHQLTAKHQQWLGLDPAAAPNATLGATIATASDGPLSTSLGRVRDLVLGLECITGTGERIRAGGRVVKNVAGFDLVRLQTGAWGTLGVITEVTMRLRALPEQDRTFFIQANDRASLESFLAPLESMRISPLALELVNSALAQRLGLPAATCLLVRLGGNANRVEAQVESLRALGDVIEVTNAPFDALRRIEQPGDVVAQVSHMPTMVSATWRRVLEQCSANQAWQPLLRASLSRGMVRLVIPSANQPEMTDAIATQFATSLAPPGAHVSWQQLPAAAWSAVPSMVNDVLSSGIRDRLDPRRVLNRGLLGETTPTAVLDHAMLRAT